MREHKHESAHRPHGIQPLVLSFPDRVSELRSWRHPHPVAKPPARPPPPSPPLRQPVHLLVPPGLRRDVPRLQPSRDPAPSAGADGRRSCAPYAPAGADARARAGAATAAAGIPGWFLPWTARDDGHILRFDVQLPGRVTHATADAQAGSPACTRVGPDLAGMVHFLHGSTHPASGLPGTLTWCWNTDAATVLVLFLRAFGVWLSWERTTPRRIALGVLAAGGAVFATLVALLLAGS